MMDSFKPTASPTPPRVPFRLQPLGAVMDMPPPSWLVDGLIEEGVLAVLYGASGEGKSFLALDWALSVASSRSWQGRQTRTGAVIYVVAEGGRGIAKRIKA